MKVLLYYVFFVGILLILSSSRAFSDEQPLNVDAEIKAMWASAFDGHVNDALARATKLFGQINPSTDEEAYWRVTSSVVEILQELENDAFADKVLGTILQSKITERNPVRRAWMQYYLGRDLLRLGHIEQGEQVLRALNSGDERQVFTPAQRFSAILWSKLEFERGNIDQSAIWMRRAVIGILVNKDAAPIDIIDVLTEYALHLTRMRRPLDALALYARLEPIYRAAVPKHSPKYIRFMTQLLDTLTTIGAYAAADRILSDLKEAVKGVDLLPLSINSTLLVQDLYQAARTVPQSGPNPLIERLQKLAADSPELLKLPEFRVAFSYFALLAGNFELAGQYARPGQIQDSETPQIRAYDVLLQSLTAAGQKDFTKSLRLARQGLDDLNLFLEGFEHLSSNWSPTLRSEERVVLSAILAANADKV